MVNFDGTSDNLAVGPARIDKGKHAIESLLGVMRLIRNRDDPDHGEPPGVVLSNLCGGDIELVADSLKQ